MARPDPTDIAMRLKLAHEATEEITERLNRLVHGDDAVVPDEFSSEVYGMLGRLAEGLGNVAMAVDMLERERSER